MQDKGPSPEGLGYRADIQGLRAVAVLLVVTFHAGLPLPGGFIGVDVFFVISGFVITAMLLREWNRSGRIRLTSFWRRRFFRLTPALALMVGATFILSALLLFPLEQQIAYQTGLGALFLVANIVIARNTGGYFDAPAEGNPLLNTWSLSVEEQFYLVFPLILLLALALERSRSRSIWLPFAVVGGVGLVSLAIALWSTTPQGMALTWLNFYSPITRSWEFALGALVALALVKPLRLKSRFGALLALLGIAGIVVSTLVITPETPFPGPWTILPVGSTALILIAGTSTNTVSAALGNPVAVRVGDWSYSIYLWHWPLIVFAIALGLSSVWWLTAIAFISLGPALASYYLVERPLRNWSPSKSWKRPVVALGVVGTPVVLVAVLIAAASPIPRFQGTVGTTYLETIQTTSFPCQLEQIPGSGSRCLQSVPDAPIDVVVVGDSHAEHLYLGARQALAPLNVAYVYLPNWPYETSANSRLTFEQIPRNTDAKAVIINSRWDLEGASSSELTTVLNLLQDSSLSVFVADDGPTFSFHAEECLYDRPLGPSPRCSEDAQAFTDRYQDFYPALGDQVSAVTNAQIINTSGGFCDAEECSMTRGDSLLFADHGHLNELGSRAVMETQVDQVEELRQIRRSAA